ncbi:MAG: hypothetical protein RBT68_15170 [Spirochaetia bacterium]|nr:hypothetical protein [Spirochaetia bacterium]
MDRLAVVGFSHDLGMNRCARALGFQTPLLGRGSEPAPAIHSSLLITPIYIFYN